MSIFSSSHTRFSNKLILIRVPVGVCVDVSYKRYFRNCSQFSKVYQLCTIFFRKTKFTPILFYILIFKPQFTYTITPVDMVRPKT